jgi:hypothetical protein
LKLKHLIFPLVVFLAATIPALADTTYTDETTFLAAAGSIVTQNFAGIAPAGSFVSYGLGGSVTLGSVSYSSDPTSQLFIVDAAYAPSLYGFMGAVASLSAQQGTFNIASSNISGGAEAIGFTYNTINGSGGPVTITLSNGDVFTFADPGSTGAFFGVITSSAVSSVSLGDAGSSGVDIGRFDYAASVAAPEPASLMLLSAGLMGIAALRRRVSA